MGGTSVVSTTIPTPALPMVNVYNTQNPNQPVVWAYATQSVINWVPGLTANSVDIGPGGFTLILDGVSAPLPLSLFLRTGPNGSFAFTMPTTSALSGLTGYFAMAHASPTSTDGFYVSQTHLVNFTPAVAPVCNSAATNLGLGDDTTTVRNLGFSFTFYGLAYTTVNIGSNGTLCYGSANPGFEFTPGSFVGAAEPQSAVFTCDLNPGAGGTVTWFTDNATFAEVCWNNVPEFGAFNSNTCRISLQAVGAIQMDYGNLDADSSNQDILVGLTPGNNLGTAQAIDLTAPPNTLGGATSAPLEFFTTFGGPLNLVDLDYRSLTFVLDGSGNPVLQL